MNRVILIGRLTRDPDVRYSQGAEPLAIARYTLAVDRRGRRDANSDQTADFISCVAFGRNGEFAEKYLKQGTKIAVTGRIQTGSYTNKDGNKVYTTDVVVEDHEFVESKGSSQASGFEPIDRPAPSSASAEGFMSIPEGVENDLPFK
ncbi:MAG: single-stranded DNA-binding protein [Lachnospiraceae bacterium]|nr:single-stranded DNA-binding protein [Lachnospiraceae bacterium]